MLKKITISSRKQILIISIALTLAALAVFWQVNHFDFVNLDDAGYVKENSRIQSGITLDGLRWVFSTTDTDGLWHPLLWLSFMFDYQLYGLNAGGYHLTNLILHILSMLLLFWLFNRMTGALWRSAFVAAFFALHPLHVESVVWIAERKDVLSAFFWMLTLCLYVYYTEKPVIQRYWLVVFSFVCALMSKPMVVTLPVIMILLDYWPLNRFESKKDNLILWQVKEKLPFFVLSAVFSIITIYAQHNPSLKYFSFGSRLANASVSFMTYLEKTFWPYDLAVFYPFSNQLPVWQILVSALLVIVISAVVIVMAKRFPCLLVGWLWYAIALLPVIGIIQSGDQAMADRYHYLSSIGIAFGLVWGIPSLIKSKNLNKKILFPAAIAFLAVLSILTWKQCGYWKNSATLFNRTLQVTKNNYLVHNNLGFTLFAEGNYKESIDHFNKAISIKEDYASAYNNRGFAFAKVGQLQKAIEDYNKAISLDPDYILAYCNRGIAYYVLGKYQSAIEDFNKAIILKQNYVEAYDDRGTVYYVLGQYQSAIEDFNKAVSLKQDYAEAYNHRGIAYYALGRYQNAIEDLNKATALKQDYAEAYNNRATIYLNFGNKESGCYDAQKACTLGNCITLKSARAKGLCR
jgi:protein O-mannosyl-transferase